MVVKGKRFVCEKCGHTVQMDYEGGAQMTQIGDFEVMRQMELIEEYADTIDEGVYILDFGICETCFEHTIPKEVVENSRRIGSLLEELENLNSKARETISTHFDTVFREIEVGFTFDELSDIAGGIDKDTFVDKRQHKGKRHSPIKTFVRNESEKNRKNFT